MQEVTRYPAGTFSWADLSTTDQDAARTFYKSLFGWDSQELPIGEGATYTMMQVDGKDVAALSQMDPEQQEQGMPPAWNSYVTVDDVDATTRQAQELGATVVAPPFDVMDTGRMSVLQDPTGGVFSLWQPGTHIGASLVNVPGALCWNELLTSAPAAAADFYTSLFGWTYTQDESGYYSLRNGERAAGGIIPKASSAHPAGPLSMLPGSRAGRRERPVWRAPARCRRRCRGGYWYP